MNRQKNQPRASTQESWELGTECVSFIEHPEGTSVLTQQQVGGAGKWWETAEQAGDSHPHFQSLKNCLKMGLSRPWGRISTCVFGEYLIREMKPSATWRAACRSFSLAFRPFQM